MPKSMVLDKNSNIYVTGDDNYSRFYSVCYNSAGNKIWSFYYPPLYPSWIYSGIKITLDRFNNLYIYGSSLDSAVLLKFSSLNGIVRNSELNPSAYSLGQNYPNPFNPTTNVKFSIIKAEQVKLIVYDIQGREVQTLVNESLKPGTYEAAFDASALNSGVYFYKLVVRHGGSSTDNFTETKKMLLIK